MSQEKSVPFKTYVDEELRNSFKAACAKKGRSMVAVLAELMESYVQAVETDTRSKSQGGDELSST
jgi:hypothetical protein